MLLIEKKLIFRIQTSKIKKCHSKINVDLERNEEPIIQNYFNGDYFT